MSIEEYKFSLEKQPSEQFTTGVDFANDLADNETISSVAVAISDLADGSDVSATMLEGSAMIGAISGKTFTEDANGSAVAQVIKAGTDGHRYNLTFIITTSAPHKFEADVILSVQEVPEA